MMLLLFLATAAQTAPGPLDAFRSNHAAIRVDADFVYTKGFVDPSVITKRRFWSDPHFSFIEIPELRLEGQWSCDGIAEYYQFGSPSEVVAEGVKKPLEVIRGKARMAYVPKVEALYDGTNYLGHAIEDPMYGSPNLITARGDSNCGLINLGKGPFCWCWREPFPKILGTYPDQPSLRRTALRAGHPTEVEIYRKNITKDLIQIEISYDPSVGFLPRFLRSVYDAKDASQVHEFYLIEARPCSAGGFLPTEWYESEFTPASVPSHYNDDTVLVPSRRVLIGHFQVTRLRDRSAPVALRHVSRAHGLSSVGGIVNISPRGTLSIEEAKAILGKKLTEPQQQPLSHLDVEELHELDEKTARRWPYYVAGLLLLSFAGAWFLRRRWRVLALLMLVLLGCSPGSGPVLGPPIAKLSAAFTPDQVLYDLDQFNIPLTLAVRNEGNRTLRILKADGGCACRQVDQSSLPKDLRPGELLKVAVHASKDRRAAFQRLTFTFETDQGPMAVEVPVTILPRQLLEPEATSHTAIPEGKPWGYELVHRMVYPRGQKRPVVNLDVPEGLATKKVGTVGGPIKGAPGFIFEDTTYRVTVTDRSEGLHKTLIVVRGPDGHQLAESQVIWRHVPFLSTVPERVVLGTHPVRVFLRCPDEDVEFTRVLSRLEGIKAVVSSVREVTITPTDNAPGTINGVIEVGTTAPGRPPLRIPIARYAPRPPA